MRYGHIYFIKSPALNAIKIGFSAHNPMTRLSACQTGNADDLIMLGWCAGYESTERKYHEWLSDCRIRGEWFRLEGKVQEFVSSFLEPYWAEIGARA